MGNGPSKRSRSRGQFGDFTSSNLPSPPPYTVAAASPLAYSPLEINPGIMHGHIDPALTPPYTIPLQKPRPAVDGAYLRRPMRAESVEDALETLRKYDTIILMDDSSSMAGSLWTEGKQALATLADVASQYDTNGIEIHFLNYRRSAMGVRDSKSVDEYFTSLHPDGPTPIGDRLDDILGDYFRGLDLAKKQEDAGDYSARKEIKPVNIIVITDGAPTDDPESVIVSYAKRLDVDRWPLSQVGIQFVQIGNSRHATRFLQDLDDSLKTIHNIRDIVDTTPYVGELNAEMLIKVLLGGINRRVDTKGGAAVMF